MLLACTKHWKFALIALTAASVLSAHAGTICTAGVCTVTIAGDSNAATSNFQSPGTTATTGYTITTRDNGTVFLVTLSTTDPNALQFANLYFDTIASTPNTGSNLGFEFGPNSEDAFYPNTGQKYDLTGTGVSAMFTQAAGTSLIQVTIPNTFFINNPDGIPFTPTTSGDLVSLHLSQSFGYSVVGGSANYPAPVELGAATVSASSAATPEPSSLVLLGTGALGMIGMVRRKLSV